MLKMLSPLFRKKSLNNVTFNPDEMIVPSSLANNIQDIRKKFAEAKKKESHDDVRLLAVEEQRLLINVTRQFTYEAIDSYYSVLKRSDILGDEDLVQRAIFFKKFCSDMNSFLSQLSDFLNICAEEFEYLSKNTDYYEDYAERSVSCINSVTLIEMQRKAFSERLDVYNLEVGVIISTINAFSMDRLLNPPVLSDDMQLTIDKIHPIEAKIRQDELEAQQRKKSEYYATPIYRLACALGAFSEDSKGKKFYIKKSFRSEYCAIDIEYKKPESSSDQNRYRRTSYDRSESKPSVKIEINQACEFNITHNDIFEYHYGHSSNVRRETHDVNVAIRNVMEWVGRMAPNRINELVAFIEDVQNPQIPEVATPNKIEHQPSI